MKQKGGFGHDHYQKFAQIFGKTSMMIAQTFGFVRYFG